MASLSFEELASRLSSSDQDSNQLGLLKTHGANLYQSLTRGNQPMLENHSLAECFLGTPCRPSVLGPLHATERLDQ